MENSAWILWTIIGILLIVGEVFTAGFVLFWFGVGALVAAFVAILGLGLVWQFLAFAVVSIILTVLSRNIFINYFAQSEELKSGVDALPGQIGTVVSPSRGALNGGEVKVFGSVWTAYPAEGESALQEGERVEVVRVKGASVYVRRIDDSLPDWRKPAEFPVEVNKEKQDI